MVSECHGMGSSRGNRDDIGKPLRNHRDPVNKKVSVRRPCAHQAVAGQRQIKGMPRGNRNGIGEIRKAHCHERITPTDNAPVREQREAVDCASANRNYVGEPLWDIRLPVTVRTPGHHGAIGSERQAVPGSSRDGHDIVEAGWNIQLSLRVLSPGLNRSIAPDGQIMGSSAATVMVFVNSGGMFVLEKGPAQAAICASTLRASA